MKHRARPDGYNCYDKQRRSFLKILHSMHVNSFFRFGNFVTLFQLLSKKKPLTYQKKELSKKGLAYFCMRSFGGIDSLVFHFCIEIKIVIKMKTFISGKGQV